MLTIMTIFKAVDDQVRFQQDLMVDTIHGLVGMMLPDELADPFCFCFGKRHIHEKAPHQRRAFFFLQGSRMRAVFLIAEGDRDVVHKGGSLKHL